MSLCAAHRHAVLRACSVGVLLWAAPALAFDEFSDERAPSHFELGAGDLRLIVKGELELEAHDLEGRGGPTFDSPTDTRTIGTRSPFVEIDSFYLAVRLRLASGLWANSEVAFGPTSTQAESAWFDLLLAGPAWLSHHLEAGRHTPFVAIDRRTERYPLAGTMYWREPEMHLTYEAEARPKDPVGASLGLSLALARPLGFAGVQDSDAQRGTINVLTYAAERVYSGVSAVAGGKLGLRVHALLLEAFGFAGRLAGEGGTDVLVSSFDNYQDLKGFNTEDRTQQNRRLLWGGGRLSFAGAGVFAVVEAIASRESLLARYTGYAQLSYRWQRDAEATVVRSLEPLVRHELYRLAGSSQVQASGRALRSPSLSQAVTWDLDITTVALICELYRELVRARLEYYVVREANGVRDLGIASTPFRNNELLVQLELRF